MQTILFNCVAYKNDICLYYNLNDDDDVVSISKIIKERMERK